MVHTVTAGADGGEFLISESQKSGCSSICKRTRQFAFLVSRTPNSDEIQYNTDIIKIWFPIFQQKFAFKEFGLGVLTVT